MIFYSARKALLDGSIVLLTDTIKVALLTDAHLSNPSQVFFSELNSFEISATGYTAGGINLTSKTVDLVSNKSVFNAADTIWNANLKARYAVVYKDTGNSGTSPLIALIDFKFNRVSYNNSFTIKWSSGIFEML